MAPPRQVAAPPKGSISVGWLWVSFLKNTSHSSVSLRPSYSISTGTTTEQALISSDTSMSSSFPSFLSFLIAIKARSIRQTYLSSLPAKISSLVSR